MKDKKACFVCNNEANVMEFIGNQLYRVECSICGEYEIDKFFAIKRTYRKDESYILSSIIRNRTIKGIYTVVDDHTIDQLFDSTRIPVDPIEKLDLIIYHLLDNTRIGEIYKYNFLKDYSIFYCFDSSEFQFLANKGVELNYFESQTYPNYLRLGIDGWKRANELKSKRIVSNNAFVAMWFDDELKDAWKNGLKPALEETGFDPVKIDLIEHNDDINDRIISEIKRSALLVADFTGNRGGVYFEAGFAYGLGIPVIWTCRKDHFKNVHFDTEHYKHIVWENSADLKEKLINRIEATIK
jgi:nucleoside 2-deoxyribosyltransferase